MKLYELKDFVHKELSELDLTRSQADFEAREIILSALEMDYSSFVLQRNDELSVQGEERILNILKERKTGKPLSYCLGERHFGGFSFFVNENVLIPRFETEILCEKAAHIVEEKGISSCLDLCTGSGCIAVVIQKKTGIRMDASDVSRKALEVAEKNAGTLGAEIRFVESDLFENIDGKYGLIVSNPPYIPENEYVLLDRGVREYEPELALLAREEGLYFYRRIAEEAKKHLLENGYLIVETGYNQGQAVREIFEKNGYRDIEIIQDYANLDRIVMAHI